MPKLETKYMGLTLRNPIIIGSSGLTNSVDKIKELETHGAGAVVLKSIFEEQILMEVNSLRSDYWGHAEEADYLAQYTQQHTLDEYLALIGSAKKAVSIPVIASINCVSPTHWTSFAKKIQDAGADALELNIFILPADYKQKGENVESIYFDIINEVRSKVTIPISVKMSRYFSGLANMIFELSVRKIQGIVLFNRFYTPDIDIEKMEVVSSHVFSSPEEISEPLRWVGMLADKVKCDLAASTGIHDGEGVLKCLLAGAKAVQIASTIYKNGPAHIETMLEQVKNWMKNHRCNSIQEFTGKLSHKHLKDPVIYERVQFMKYFTGAKI
jgi:dihydroorotate dehydrogenase (fumarate)